MKCIVTIRTSCAGIAQFPYDDEERPAQQKALKASVKMLAQYNGEMDGSSDKSIDLRFANERDAKGFEAAIKMLGFTVD